MTTTEPDLPRPTRSCRDCTAWHPALPPDLVEPLTLGECRKWAPSVTVVAVNAVPGPDRAPRAVWASTQANEWCTEYRAAGDHAG